MLYVIVKYSLQHSGERHGERVARQESQKCEQLVSDQLSSLSPHAGFCCCKVNRCVIKHNCYKRGNSVISCSGLNKHGDIKTKIPPELKRLTHICAHDVTPHDYSRKMWRSYLLAAKSFKLLFLQTSGAGNALAAQHLGDTNRAR